MNHQEEQLSSTITARINGVEAWIDDRPRPLVLCPLRLLASLGLLVVLMASNMIALLQWPFSAVVRVLGLRKATPGEPLHVGEQRLIELVEGERPVLVDFWAQWCGPCLLMNPTLRRFAQQEAPRLVVAKVDVTLHPLLARKHHINALPTLLLFHNGQEAGRRSGLMSLRQMQEFVQDHLPAEV